MSARRKARQHVEGIRHAIDASSNADLAGFPIEAQFMIVADIDKHPCIARSRGPSLSPHQYGYLGCEQMQLSEFFFPVRFRAAETARARSSCFLRSAFRSCCSLELIISDLLIDTSTGISR